MNYRSVYLSLLILFIAGYISILALSKNFSYPFPQAKISPLENYVIVDLAGVLGGFRRLAADMAWIQLLVYYGTTDDDTNINKESQYKMSWEYLKFLAGMPNKLSEEDEHHHDTGKPGEEFNGHPAAEKEGLIDKSQLYQELYTYCKRVVFLDPFFDYAYLYGAGALAWNQDRPAEAVDLLNYGITQMEIYQKDITKDIHSPFWQFHLYLGAIIYRKEGNFEKMKESLVVAVNQPNCPNMVRAILASIYNKDKNYPQALKLWLNIYDTNDPTYQKRALEEIYKLKKLLSL